MAKKNVNFKQIYDFMEKEQRKELAQAAPLHEVLLDMIVEKLPSASVSQKYRIPHIWRGEKGRSTVRCWHAICQSRSICRYVRR